MQHRTIDLGSGRTLHARRLGAGADVVLIHGALTTSHDWLQSPVATALAKRHRLTIVDRPGHGLSRRPRFAGTPREQADQIAEGLRRLGVERAIFAAHSFGCLVALALAERHPERVAGLVLVAPLAFAEPRLLEHSLFAPRALPLFGPLWARMAAFSQIERPLLPLVHKVMFSPGAVPDEWRATYPYDTIMTAEAMVMEGEDSSAVLPFSSAAAIDLSRVQAPARVLTGTLDRIVEDERQAKALAWMLPNARLVEIEGAGHMLHHSHAALVTEAVQNCLPVRSTGRGTRRSLVEG